MGDNAMSQDGVNRGRRRFLTAATSVVGAAGAVAAAVPFVGSWNPSARARAAGAPVRADIGRLEPGQMVVVEWRGKPVYLLRRTQAALDSIDQLDDRLADPESERSSQPDYITGRYRSIKDELLVILGLCTHLGCAPSYRPEVGPVERDWLGGSSAPATVPSSIWPAGSTRTPPLRPTWKSRHTATKPIRSWSSVKTRRSHNGQQTDQPARLGG